MKQSRKWIGWLTAASLVVLLAPQPIWADDDRDEKGRGPCTIEGTWYGFNSLGEVFVITITRTGAKTYSAVGLQPEIPPSAFPGLISSHSIQGDLTKKGARTFESSWMAIWALDPEIWGYGLGNLTASGEVTLTSCDTWEATFTTDILGFDLGDDAFEGEELVTFPPYVAFYQRLPRLEQ